MHGLTYVLVTAAKNEEKYIQRTLDSVVSQSVPPFRWIIVDDGSSDRTAAVADAYAGRYSWITVVRRIAGPLRNFASKALAFAAGYERLAATAFDCIGNLDADVAFPRDYYQRLLEFFALDGSLGIAGGKFRDCAANGKSYPSTNSPDSVRGPVQMFRKKCYEDIGGYQPLPLGGIDAAAEITARMKGWKVRTIADLEVLHLRPTGSALWSPLAAMVRNGHQDHSLGYHGLFEAARCGAQMKKRPYVMGGLSRFLGYCWSWAKGDPFALPAETVDFLRREQRSKIFGAPRRIWSGILSRINQVARRSAMISSK
jgi:glycosyltransferase involved in cell wall biosynthesis